MLLAPGGEGHVGVNVQDTSTIVVQDRQYFLGVLYQTGGVAYRTLRHLVTQRDLRPETAVNAPDQSSLTMPSLRSMGAVLYKLLLPDRMKDELLREVTCPRACGSGLASRLDCRVATGVLRGPERCRSSRIMSRQNVVSEAPFKHRITSFWAFPVGRDLSVVIRPFGTFQASVPGSARRHAGRG